MAGGGAKHGNMETWGPCFAVWILGRRRRDWLLAGAWMAMSLGHVPRTVYHALSTKYGRMPGFCPFSLHKA